MPLTKSVLAHKRHSHVALVSLPCRFAGECQTTFARWLVQTPVGPVQWPAVIPSIDTGLLQNNHMENPLWLFVLYYAFDLSIYSID